MHHVVIVESPAKCKTINKYLGKDYTVLASFGHIRDLPSKDGSVRPDDDFAMDYEVSNDSKKHVKAISDAVKGADSLILATDPDREGEAISWHVLEALKSRKALKKDTKIQRVAFNSITKSAVQDAIANPRELDMNLVNAQQARRALDYLVGFNLSPVLWRKLPGSKSAGRVQSVALRLICDREGEIEAFVSQEYWDITGKFKNIAGNDFTARLTHSNGEKLDKLAISNDEQAQALAKQAAQANYAVSRVTKKQAKRNPYAPFTTSTLQQEASRKLGFSATRTMQTAQKLYEGIDLGGETTGLITYMRTDGVTVAPEAISATRDMISSNYGNQYVPKSPRIYQSKAKNAQEAHEAIRPTDPARTPAAIKSRVNEDQFRLYELIWKRLIASQMESIVLDQVMAEIISQDGKLTFRANGSTVVFDGFSRLYNEGKDDDKDDDGDKLLPPLNEGESATLVTPEPAQHFTQPPPRFTEASLVKKMEELGIGRPSTYASILAVLQNREYVRLDKKRFIPEMRGRLVTAFLQSFFNRYVEYDFTARLENQLDEVSGGNLDWKEALRLFWGDFHSNVDSAMKLEFTQVIDELSTLLSPLLFPGEGDESTRRTCPSCSKGTLGLRLGKFGAFVGCSDYPECSYTRQLSTGDGDNNASTGAAGVAEPRQLGIDPVSNLEITLRKGPYGFYVQLGEPVGKDKPKRQSLPKGVTPEDVDITLALGLLSLPREVGIHPESGKKITASIGRFGPYIQHDGRFISLKEDDVLIVGINRAVDLIASAGAKKGAEPLRIIGKHPETEKDIGVYEGRYGPYVKHEKINASLPKDESPETLSLDKALELLEKQAAKKKSTTKKKAPAKKAATAKKKTPAKKTATTKKKTAATTKKAPAKKKTAE